jgi:hypothetical protein
LHRVAEIGKKSFANFAAAPFNTQMQKTGSFHPVVFRSEQQRPREQRARAFAEITPEPTAGEAAQACVRPALPA